jgi:hypothetical protein
MATAIANASNACHVVTEKIDPHTKQQLFGKEFWDCHGTSNTL